VPEFESFCVYGFHTVYPNTWKVEFDPKSDRLKGDVVFKSPERDNIFLSWGSLEKAKKRFSNPEGHLKYSIDRIKKNTRVSGVDIAKKRDFEVSSHKALVSLLKVTFSSPSIVPFKKVQGEVQEIRAMHLHCEDTGRYYVIFGQVTMDKSKEHEEIFSKMIESFGCHIK
jgi:hypothetical protein